MHISHPAAPPPLPVSQKLNGLRVRYNRLHQVGRGGGMSVQMSGQAALRRSPSPRTPTLMCRSRFVDLSIDGVVRRAPSNPWF